MITIRDYASDVGVSYEAVRQQIKRYSKELKGHIHQDGRTQFLDDAAVSFLNEKRAKNPVVVYDKGRDQRLQELEEENKDLWKALNEAKDKVIELVGAQAQLEIAQKTQLLLEESRDEYKEQAKKAAQEASEEHQRAITLENEKKALEAEIEALKKRSWWDVLTKRK